MLLPPDAARTEVIEVVRIPDPTAYLGARAPETIVGDRVATWESDAARQALGLIGGLPDGEPRRCFFPGWGIRAHAHGHAAGPLFEIAFCFQCHGALLWGPSVPAEQHGRLQSFAADGPAGQELLARFRTAGAPPGA